MVCIYCILNKCSVLLLSESYIFIHILVNKTIQSSCVKSCRKSCLIWLWSQRDIDVMLTLFCLRSAPQGAQAVWKLTGSWEAGVCQADGDWWERWASPLIISECSVTLHGSRLLHTGGSAARAAWVISVLWQSSGGNCTGGWSCDCTGPSAHLILSQHCDTLIAASFFSLPPVPPRLWRPSLPLLHPPGNDSGVKLDHRAEESRLFPVSACFVHLFADWIMVMRQALMNLWATPCHDAPEKRARQEKHEGGQE